MKYNNSLRTILTPLLVAGAVVLGIFLGGRLFSKTSTERVNISSNVKVDRLLQLIQHNYVDTIDMDSLSEEVIPLILGELDPHSTYIPLKDMSAMNESLDGEFDGIGVMFNMMTDTVIVLSVINSGPSFKAGVLAGDRIITINDTVVAGVEFGQEQVMKRLRGLRGTEVNLGIQRVGIEGLVPITVTRGVIPITCIQASYMIAPEVGYVAFTQFSRNAHMELLEAIYTLRIEGAKKLILDLRGNMGGYLDQAIMIADEFLPAGRQIVYTKDRKGNKLQQFTSGQGTLQDVDLVVLLDEYSASSSEILAGALQDNDRGVLVGRRSFGKGLVQEQIAFSDGSAVRLTVARYYTPTGRSIQKPYNEGSEAYARELQSRYEHNEFFEVDSTLFADSLRFITPAGKVVYGGGGIMPDYFVPIDTTNLSRYFREVAGRNILYRFTIKYADEHRAALNKITTTQELDAHFAANPNLLNEFVAYAKAEGVSPVWSQIRQSRAALEAQLKGYIGRNTPLEESAFYHAIESIDPVVAQALQLLE